MSADADDVPEVPAVPAATAVLLRDGDHGLETLMVRRNADLAFAGGSWVWPGGRIDDPDHDPARPDDLERAARRAAVRETFEETALRIEADSLVWFAHWTPPPISPKRFATWFFAGAAPGGEVAVDGGEIHEHRWIGPARALQLRNEGEIQLHPPTWITLEQLCGFDDVESALRALAGRPAEHFSTRLAVVEGGAVALYHGDAGYEAADASIDGPRHRLWMMESGWRYERDA